MRVLKMNYVVVFISTAHCVSKYYEKGNFSGIYGGFFSWLIIVLTLHNQLYNTLVSLVENTKAVYLVARDKCNISNTIHAKYILQLQVNNDQILVHHTPGMFVILSVNEKKNKVLWKCVYVCVCINIQTK